MLRMYEVTFRRFTSPGKEWGMRRDIMAYSKYHALLIAGSFFDRIMKDDGHHGLAQSSKYWGVKIDVKLSEGI